MPNSPLLVSGAAAEHTGTAPFEVLDLSRLDPAPPFPPAAARPQPAHVSGARWPGEAGVRAISELHESRATVGGGSGRFVGGYTYLNFSAQRFHPSLCSSSLSLSLHAPSTPPPPLLHPSVSTTAAASPSQPASQPASQTDRQWASGIAALPDNQPHLATSPMTR
ncbi:hypothetical protein O3P69_015880 [Scylla paramamosain]|uniref:Uncharacterized protein n=1 Tax=Scylla paramamosain TaxID=85552 RepID=A0AAW0T805_SCYPA